MQIIKLSATDSTNSYLKNLMLEGNLSDLTVIVAENQTKGRGQMSASWESEAGNNLTFSVLKKHRELNIEHQFLISICVSLAIYNVLTDLSVPRVMIKWPNDILSGTSKLCGILIENIISGSKVKASIIGIGLNVNQLKFSDNLKATSIKLELKQEQHLESLLKKIMDKFFVFLERIDGSNKVLLYKEYEKYLFRKGIVSTFQKPDETVFTGIISGITPEGNLRVKLKDDTYEEYGLKEVKLLF